MPSVSLCFRIHQPYQFKEYGFNDIGQLHAYEDKVAMAAIMDNIADNCYLPANKILHNQIKNTKGEFRFAFSISGTTLELFDQFRPDLIKSFRQLIETGCVEILGETYYNSLSWLHSKTEFNRQVKKHDALVKELFGIEPLVFCNTELIYDNDLAKHIAGLGYKGIISEGISNILKDRSPNQTYASPDNGDFGIMLRNTALSNEIAGWVGKAKASLYALTAEKFADRVFHSYPDDSCNINIFLDYETFGIHKTSQTGIFNFLEELPAAILSNQHYCFKTPVEVLDKCYPKDIYDAPDTNSLQSNSTDTGIWTENVKQNNIIKKLYKLERLVTDANDARIQDTWGKLQSADHFSFIPGNQRSTGEIYQLKNPLLCPGEEYQQFVNILTDFEILLIKKNVEKNRSWFSNQVFTMLF
jgi:alpha-amylase